MTLKSSSLPSRCATSRTGRMSTKEPGRNARIGPISTVKPPFTLPEIIPFTISSSSKAFSSSPQTSARLAFSRDRRVKPMPSSMASTATSTSSPSAISSSPASLMNSSRAIMPSDFRPALTVTQSLSMDTTVPLMMEPRATSRSLRLSSKRSAKDSVMKFTLYLSHMPTSRHGLVNESDPPSPSWLTFSGSSRSTAFTQNQNPPSTRIAEGVRWRVCCLTPVGGRQPHQESGRPRHQPTGWWNLSPRHRLPGIEVPPHGSCHGHPGCGCPQRGSRG